jgi:hypothetical protein
LRRTNHLERDSTRKPLENLPSSQSRMVLNETTHRPTGASKGTAMREGTGAWAPSATTKGKSPSSRSPYPHLALRLATYPRWLCGALRQRRFWEGLYNEFKELRWLQ